jgi:hypothetical protein
MVQPVQRAAEAEPVLRNDPAVTSAVAEPATPRALWPTFMRRTLAEETLRRQPEPAAAS